ncbi:uncharacterized protein [Apostichopus japonicus]|uniref:uncharacterized protein n=1 Tax=Stichopus japonicus TaxID=307972 RepID=UPI003AB18F54
MNDALVSKYGKFKEHLASVFARKNVWAISHRDSLPVRGNHTKNFCEAAMRIVRDKVLYRMKGFNVTQLVDFMDTRFEMYYECRLTDLANNRMSNLVNSKFFLRDHSVYTFTYMQIDDSYYRVPSFSTGTTEVVYDVNMDVGTCTSPVGKTGGPCKHQHAVMRAYNLQGSNFVSVSTPKHRQMFYYITTDPDILHCVKGITSLKNLLFYWILASPYNCNHKQFFLLIK